MDYEEVYIKVRPGHDPNIVTALLADYNFESYEIDASEWKGYIPQEQLDWAHIIASHIPEELVEKWNVKVHEYQNWNAVWESDYPLVKISDQLLIKAPFHEAPEDFSGLVIDIQPKMSFGTGHHNTTALISNYMYEMQLDGKRILDMGAGTGILAILAEKLGAREILAVDNEVWAFENMQENVELNKCQNIDCWHDDKVPTSSGDFDVIVANINKNILFDFSTDFSQILKSNGYILLSGFFDTDIEDVNSKYASQGLTEFTQLSRDGWAMCVLKKQ